MSDGDGVGDPAGDLLDALDRSVAGWIERAILATAAGARGGAGRATFGGDGGGPGASDELRAAATAAGEQARAAVVAELRALFALDVAAQPTNPLSVLRRATRFATEVLERENVAPAARDEFQERAFPGDRYALAPATWADVDPALVEPGLVWGAWKAAVLITRRRTGGSAS